MTTRINFRQDTAKGGWWFSVPYNATFIDELKYCVSSRRRSYNPATHEWFAEHGVLPTVVRLLRTYFSGCKIGYDGVFQDEYQPPLRDRSYSWERNNTSETPFSDWLRNEIGRQDPYQVLGLARGTSYNECNKRYRELAKQWHPSRNGGVGAEEMMKKINEAWSLIRKEMGR